MLPTPRVAAFTLAALLAVPGVLTLTADSTEATGLPDLTPVVVPRLAIFGLYPGTTLDVFLLDMFGNQIVYPEANIGVAFFSFQNMTQWDPTTLNPRHYLNDALYFDMVSAVDVAADDGRYEFVYPNIPGYDREPGLLWVYYDNAAPGGDTHQSYYMWTEQTIRHLHAPGAPVQRDMATITFANSEPQRTPPPFPT